jgi:antitoxin PrlF
MRASTAAGHLLDVLSRNSYHTSMKAIVSEKGQVTIPKSLRDKLGIRPGTVLDFGDEQGRLVARKQSEVDVIRKWRGRGKLPGGMDVDAYLNRLRQ